VARYCENGGCLEKATWFKPTQLGSARCEAHKQVAKRGKLDRLKKQVAALEAEIEESEKSYRKVETA
jgi:hypothetical protein